MRVMTKVKFISILSPLFLLPFSFNASAENAPAGNASAPATAAASTGPDITGSYTCTYHDPLSSPTDSSETIAIKKFGDNYRITLTTKDSVVPYGFGIGMMNKNMNNAFAYIYWQPKTPTTTTVEFFMIKPDGSLDGVFAESNKSKIGTEVCTKSS